MAVPTDIQSKRASRNRLSLFLPSATVKKEEDDDTDKIFSVKAAETDCPDQPCSIAAAAAAAVTSPPGFLSHPSRSATPSSPPSNAKSGTWRSRQEQKDKKKVSRNGRKLSRVFSPSSVFLSSPGQEPPVTIDAQLLPSLDKLESSLSLPQLPAESARKKRIRPWSPAHSRSTSPVRVDFHRIKSFFSSKSVSISANEQDPAAKSETPVGLSESAPSSVHTAVEDQAIEPPHSENSFTLPEVELDLEKRRRARRNKLSRHFGESVPSALIADSTAENLSRSLGVPQGSTDSASLSPQDSLRRTRRRSIEISMLPGASPSSSDFPSVNKGHSLVRSRSVWSGSRRRVSREIIDDMSIDIGVTFEAFDPVLERHRFLNVKRARKMRQVFGSEPPPALYQITNLLGKQECDPITPMDGKCTPSVPAISVEKQQTSKITPGELSPSPPVEMQQPSDAITPEPQECGEPDNEVSEDSHGPALFSSVVSVSPEQPPPHEGPFSKLPQISSEDVEPPEDFGMRRRRAAKLSQFFGIGYQDLSLISRLDVSRKRSESSTISRPPLPERVYASQAEVGVKISEPSGFWGLIEGRQEVKEVDPSAVIDRLRGLKAAT